MMAHFNNTFDVTGANWGAPEQQDIARVLRRAASVLLISGDATVAAIATQRL